MHELLYMTKIHLYLYSVVVIFRKETQSLRIWSPNFLHLRPQQLGHCEKP